MRKIAIYLLVACHLFLAAPLAGASTGVKEPTANPCSSAYAAWTGTAQQKLHADNPGVSILDFLYVGCKAQSPSTKLMIYKYWVSGGGREYGVYVNLLVDSQRNELLRSFSERTDTMIAAYGQWRRLAVEAIQKQYPDATIIDYTPCSCSLLDASTASQTFKFWIQGDAWKFVYVTIKYNLGDEEVQSISFEEKAR